VKRWLDVTLDYASPAGWRRPRACGVCNSRMLLAHYTLARHDAPSLVCSLPVEVYHGKQLLERGDFPDAAAKQILLGVCPERGMKGFFPFAALRVRMTSDGLRMTASQTFLIVVQKVCESPQLVVEG